MTIARRIMPMPLLNVPKIFLFERSPNNGSFVLYNENILKLKPHKISQFILVFTITYEILRVNSVI